MRTMVYSGSEDCAGPAPELNSTQITTRGQRPALPREPRPRECEGRSSGRGTGQLLAMPPIGHAQPHLDNDSQRQTRSNLHAQKQSPRASPDRASFGATPPPALGKNSHGGEVSQSSSSRKKVAADYLKKRREQRNEDALSLNPPASPSCSSVSPVVNEPSRSTWHVHRLI